MHAPYAFHPAVSPHQPLEARNVDRAWESIRTYEQIHEGAASILGLLLAVSAVHELAVRHALLSFVWEATLLALVAAVGVGPRLLRFRHGIGEPKPLAVEERELLTARARTVTCARLVGYGLLAIFLYTRAISVSHATFLVLLGAGAEWSSWWRGRRALARLGVAATGLGPVTWWLNQHWAGRGWFGHALDHRSASVAGAYGGLPVLHLASTEGEMLWYVTGTTLLAAPRRGGERPLEPYERARYATLGFEVEVHEAGLIARSTRTVVTDPMTRLFDGPAVCPEQHFTVAMRELFDLAARLGRVPAPAG